MKVIILLLLLTFQSAFANILFQDNFEEDAIYTDNATFDPEKIQFDHGHWGQYNQGNYQLVVSTDHAFSGRRSLLLKTGDMQQGGESNRAQALALFSEDGEKEALTIEFAFLLDEGNLEGNIFVVVRGNTKNEEHQNSANLVINSALFMNLREGNSHKIGGDIITNEWYKVRINMPAFDGKDSDPMYTVTLSDAGGAEIGSFTAPFKKEGIIDYRYLAFMNEGTVNRSIFIDDVSVSANGANK